ncbi:hypothetical protein ACJBUE_06310 [Ralstonia syzygii subsp. celebesensis]|uniref:hypothetical protein n=1 Tax=Ralstonia syzygii TaxID=28097 RepID=UPI00387E114A
MGFGKLSTDHADTREQQRTAIRRTFAQFAKELNHDLEDYDNAALEHPALNDPLSPEERDELMEAMKVAHIWIAATRVPGGDFEKPLRLRLFFGGTQNFRDVRQDISSAFGRIADVDRAAKRAGNCLRRSCRIRIMSSWISLAAHRWAGPWHRPSGQPSKAASCCRSSRR